MLDAADDGVTAADVAAVQADLDATREQLSGETSRLNTARSEQDRLSGTVADLETRLDAAERDRAALSLQITRGQRGR
jgi:chromosome segregation ATPase